MNGNSIEHRDEKHIRFDALHSALSYALQKTLSKLTLKAFVSCYPEIDHTTLDYVRKQIIKSWQTRAELEFQKIFAEKELKEKLDLLDDVIENAERRKESTLNEVPNGENEENKHIHVNIVSFTPSELSKTYIVKEKEKSLKALQNELSTIQRANEDLISRMNHFTTEINKNINDITTTSEELRVLDEIDETTEENSFKEMVEWAVNEITKATS